MGGPAAPASRLWARYYDFGAGRLPGFRLKLIQDNQGNQG